MQTDDLAASDSGLPPPVGLADRVLSLGHTEAIRALAASPDGRLALSSSDDKTARLWDLESGICLRVFEGHENTVAGVAFAPDGRRAVTASYDHGAKLWELSGGSSIAAFQTSSARLWCAAFSPDGRRIYAGASDNAVRVWEIESGLRAGILTGHSARVLALAVCPDGRRLVSGSYDKTLRLWDAESGGCLAVLEGHGLSVAGVAVSPDGRRALSASADRSLRLWELSSGKCLRVLEGHLAAVHGVAFDAGGRRAISCSADQRLRLWDLESGRCLRVFEGHGDAVTAVAMIAGGRRAVSASADKTLRIWDLASGKCLALLGGHLYNVAAAAWTGSGERAVSAAADHSLRVWHCPSGRSERTLKGHTGGVLAVALAAQGQRLLSGSADRSLRLWSADSPACLRVMKEHAGSVQAVALDARGKLALSGSADKTLRLWELDTGRCLRVFSGHTDAVLAVAFDPGGGRLLSGAADRSVRLWDAATGNCLFEAEGHYAAVEAVAFHPGGARFLTASADRTLALWDAASGHCLRVFEGHAARVSCLAFSPDGRRAASGSADGTVRIWSLEEGRCEQLLEGHRDGVVGVGWSADGGRIFSAAANGVMRLRALVPSSRGTFRGLPLAAPAEAAQVSYTNAKVLLVGDSGAGKTGLSRRLAQGDWQPSDSTVGAWATQWKLDLESPDGDEREIWLWDFGGQADQRLIHQLYMEDTAVTVLVFDGQKDDLFETLGQWDRDLARACRRPFTKLLAQGRVDAGGLRASRAQLEAFAAERGYALPLLETSAKQNLGCTELKDAILAGIAWERIPWRSSPRVFKRLKDEILRLKDEGRVLLRLAELRDVLASRLAEGGTVFTAGELAAVLGLLAGPGVLWELSFGSWVLLQPERINAYAQAVLQTLREDGLERGCLPEERVLRGELTYHSSLERLPADDERFVLLAMVQTLVERDLCLREHTEQGPLLIFPSYYRRERPELIRHPAVLVSYRLAGFLDDIYATLVVRLHHTRSFEQDQLWRHAADFRTLTGRKLGIKLTRQAEGAGELEIYFEPGIPTEEKIIFSRYVHEHLLQKSAEARRLRHYVCPHCATPVGSREVAMRRLDAWLGAGSPGASPARARPGAEPPTIVCQECEKRVPLWDDLEQSFASPEIRERVRELQEEADHVLDNESRERVLVGDVITTVALAGQISRELTVSDHGIDMEIELKNDRGEASGKKLYLQLKSGDSYLRERKSDGAEIFRIAKERHAEYWRDQAFPVLLVIRESGGEIRWMEIRDLLRRESAAGPVRQIVFEGERFDVASVRRWRERVFALPL